MNKGLGRFLRLLLLGVVGTAVIVAAVGVKQLGASGSLQILGDTGAALYFIVGTVLTLYQGYRGFMFQWILADRAKWTTEQRVVLLCIADTILYLVSSAAGFAALWLTIHLLPHDGEILQASAGGAALLVFLFAFGVLGIAGQLPHLLQQGKLAPWPGGGKE